MRDSRPFSVGERHVTRYGIPFYVANWREPDGRICIAQVFFRVGKRGQPVIKSRGSSLIDAPKGVIMALRECRKVEARNLKAREERKVDYVQPTCGRGYEPQQAHFDGSPFL